MDELQISKNAQVVKYFLKRANALGRTRLVKLTYLADLHARETLGRPISEFNYQWHNFGPWDDAFFATFNELTNNRLAAPEERRLGDYTEKRLVDADGPVSLDFSLAELEILNWVYGEYVNSPLKHLLYEVVYETEPMQQVRAKGDPLPMAVVDNTVRRTMGYDPEEILAIEEELDLGHYLPMETVFDELRNPAVA